MLDRLEVYASLGVPEVWRFDGERLAILVLGPDRRYAESTTSPTFPRLPLAELARFLGQRRQVDETRLVKSFRAWVRATLA